MLSASSVSISRSFPARSKSHQHFIYAPLQRFNPRRQIAHVLSSFFVLTRLNEKPFRHNKSRERPAAQGSKSQHPRLLIFALYSALAAWLLTFASRPLHKGHTRYIIILRARSRHPLQFLAQSRHALSQV